MASTMAAGRDDDIPGANSGGADPLAVFRHPRLPCWTLVRHLIDPAELEDVSAAVGERVTRSALAGALIGFAGVLVLVGVDPSHLEASMLIPLGTACSFALFSLLTRELRSARPAVTLFYSGLVGTAAASVLFVVVPPNTSPQPWQWVAIAVVGLTALTGHRLLVAACR